MKNSNSTNEGLSVLTSVSRNAQGSCGGRHGGGERNALFVPAMENELTASGSDATTLLNYHADMNANEQLNPDSGWLNLGVPSDVEYQEYYDSLQETNIGKLQQVNDEIAENNISGAQSINSSIVPANAIETTSRIVNEIYLNYISMDSSYLTASDSATLNAIAHLNAYYYGPGVYTARALLNLFLPEPPIGSEYRFEEKTNTEKEIAFNWIVYPNPSNEFATILISGDEKQFYRIEVLDIVGRKLQTIEGQGIKKLISFVNYPAGVYEINLKVNTQNKGTKKIVIVK